ncbi:hypothetical protein [Natronomonas amylolytica]|uniref:hypothetical protein n=1 Tax=Natronomonas amylolytica TaxID=3108498 RepID=UPI003009D554
MTEDSLFPDGFLIPISGLLAVVLAVLAGASAPAAFAGDIVGIAGVVVFGGGSIALMVFRYRHGKRREAAAEGGAGPDEE